MKYVALMKGIMPGNPNMHGSALKKFFEGLGFKNVRPVISMDEFQCNITLAKNNREWHKRYTLKEDVILDENGKKIHNF